MVDVYDERDELSRKLFELEEKINSIRAWLETNGWAKNKELPDHMAANYRPSNGEESLADLVYNLWK